MKLSIATLFLALFISGSAYAGSGALRITCDGDAEGALVYLNGKVKGECPLDIKVPEGTLRLRVVKNTDAEHDPRVFEKELVMGDGVVKKVEVQLSPLELNAEGKRRQAEEARRQAEKAREEVRQVLASIESGMIAIPGRNYAMGKYEVTKAQWRAVMGSLPDQRFTGSGDLPVESVNWDDVHEFLARLNQLTGRQYRLPNEAEWEYACLGGSQSEYCGGNDINAVAWYGGNSGNLIHVVGQKQANGYGLYDMSGNVREWIEYCYKDTNYVVPVCVLRGGSWSGQPGQARAAYRDIVLPTSGYLYASGFRLARTLP